METEGMTDLQFKSHLREVIRDFKRVEELGVSAEAKAEIEKIITDHQCTISSS